MFMIPEGPKHAMRVSTYNQRNPHRAQIGHRSHKGLVMFTIRKSVFWFLTVISWAASAKDFALQVLTPTEANAPVSLYGTLTGNTDSAGSHQFSCAAHLSITNVSNKPILLIVTESRARLKANGVVVATLDQRDVNDYFLKSDLLAPQKTLTLESRLFPQRDSAETLKSLNSPSAKVLADAWVVFVQFSDGSTWGNQTVGKDSLAARERAWRTLEVLNDAYQSKDEQKFMRVLKGPDGQGYLADLFLIYERTNDIDAVAREMKSLLQLGSWRMRLAHEAQGT
jgi:hypothetical protein